MHRRDFLKNTSLGSLGLMGLSMGTFTAEDYFTTAELMGKAEVELMGKGINLRKRAHDAYVEMKKAAFKAGFDVKMVSSYRSFDRQRSIWERKYTRYTQENGMKPSDAIYKIIEYSTIPGTSRHHWGTDIDIIDGNKKSSGDVLVTQKFEGDGPYAPLKKWLDENSEDFGYYLVYTNDPLRKGFKYEPWHYSYAPLSIPMLKQFRNRNILRLIRDEDFMGIKHFTRAFVKEYIHNNILDINPVLL